MSFDAFDSRALERAVAIARNGIGEVEPNPPVGAVVYRRDHILAEGYHRCYGEAHAELDVLGQLEHVPADASLAITLEPCTTAGKQPPCVDALIQRGVRRVVVGELDPNPQHRGQARATLEDHGVEVCHAPAGAVPDDLLAPFRAYLGRSRPHVLLKWAEALDGRWSPTGQESRQLSGPEARTLVHTLRAHVDGILVGSQTVLDDDPLLTARPPGNIPLRRVVLDQRGRLPAGSRLVNSNAAGEVVQVVGAGAPPSPRSVTRVEFQHTRDLAGEVLPQLQRLGIQRLLVEGGPTVAASFLNARCVDVAWVFVAPILFGRARGSALPWRDLEQTTRPQVEFIRRVGCDAWFKLSF